MGKRVRYLAAALVATGLSVAAPAARAQSIGPMTFRATTAAASDDLDLLVDVAPPRVQFAAPLEGSRLGATSTTITGTVTDASSNVPSISPDLPGNVFQTVEWELRDGEFGVQGVSGTAPIVDGRFVIPDLPLFLGANVLVVFPRDAADWSEPATLSFEVDPNAPAAALVGVRDGGAVLSQSLSVDLNFAFATTVVSLNGVPDGRSFPAGVAPDIFDLPLALGANTFTLELESGGQTSTFSFTLYRVASREPIAIVQPIDRAIVNTTSVPVSVRAPLGTPFVTLNGRPAVRGADLQTFTADVPLAEGSNTVEAIAYPFGQRASVRVGRDTTPPRIIAMSPATPRTLLAADVTFQGLASEPVKLEIYAASDSYQTRTITISDPAGGFFSPKLHTFEVPGVALEPGLNEILMVLADRAGNLTEVPITLTRSDTALRILDPVAGSSISALETSLRLEAVEALSLQALHVGGRQLTSFRSRALQPGISQFNAIPLAPGTNDIRVVYQRYGGPQEVLLTTVTSTATPVATLRGQLTDAVTGAPVGGATLTITHGAEELVLTSGSDGRYQTDVPPGPFSLVVRRSGFLPAYLSDDVAVGETLEMDAALLRWATGIVPATPTGSGAAASHLEGLVTTAGDGLPLAGAQVRVTAASTTLTAVSDGDGAFEIGGIPVGPFSVAVSKTGFLPLSYEIDNTEAVDARIAPALTAVGTETLVVASVQNPETLMPEPGVRATLLGPNQRFTSDPGGHFQFTVGAGRNSLRLEKAGYADGLAVFDARPSADGAPMVLTLPFPGAAGHGRFIAVSPGDTATVRDRFSSRGIPGAQVLVAGQTIVTDANGVFLIPALPEIDTHDLVASAANYEPQTLRIAIAPGGNEAVEFDLLSRVRGSVSGTVRDEVTQAGLSMATVKVAGSADQITHTNSDGSFLLDGVAPGTYDLEVTHPQYLAETVHAVAVAVENASPADANLVHRPVIGGLRGRVFDPDTHEAVAGAVVSHASLSTTSDALGRYELAGLPAGMTTVSISAAGYPAATRDVAVAADRDTNTPTTVGFDLPISAASAPLPDLPVEVLFAAGGRVSDPSGRLTVIMPPLSINADARITVRLSEAPEVASGQTIPLDPSLQAPEIRAVGPEMQIRLEPLSPGGAVPRPVAPWILIHRYSAASASTAGVAEDLLVPYVWNGTSFTMFQVVPYMHAVDAIDRVVVVAVNPGATASGSPVFAGLVGKSLPLYAALDGPQPTAIGFELSLQLGAPQAPQPSPAPFTFALVRDLRQAPELNDPEFPDSQPHPNGHPLIGIHGWNYRHFFTDSNPVENPFEQPPQGDDRFAQIFTDLVQSTAGIYRPIWTSYNTRARAQATAWAMYSELSGALGGPIQGIPSDPSDPNSGRYGSVDVFGFSKGGLVGRSLLCKPSLGIRGAVALATPHHGALSGLRFLLDVPFFSSDPAFPPYLDPSPGAPIRSLREVINAESPGTAELLDYSDNDPTENPYLSGLNRLPCSGSAARMALISGRDGIQLDPSLIIPLFGSPNLGFISAMETRGLLPAGTTALVAGLPQAAAAEILAPLFSAGVLLNWGESDGVVPVWSARGRDRDGGSLPAFAGLEDDPRENPDPAFFNHLNVGTSVGQAALSV